MMMRRKRRKKRKRRRRKMGMLGITKAIPTALL
jgi:hypothetical protein